MSGKHPKGAQPVNSYNLRSRSTKNLTTTSQVISTATATATATSQVTSASTSVTPSSSKVNLSEHSSLVVKQFYSPTQVLLQPQFLSRTTTTSLSSSVPTSLLDLPLATVEHLLLTKSASDPSFQRVSLSETFDDHVFDPVTDFAPSTLSGTQLITSSQSSILSNEDSSSSSDESSSSSDTESEPIMASALSPPRFYGLVSE